MRTDALDGATQSMLDAVKCNTDTMLGNADAIAEDTQLLGPVYPTLL